MTVQVQSKVLTNASVVIRDIQTLSESITFGDNV